LVLEIGGERARRALTWMVVAVLGLLAAGIVYLRPSFSASAARSVSKTGVSVGPPFFFNVSFGDAEHGVVQVFRQVNPPNRPPPIYLTADGGRTWKPLANPRNDIFAVTFVGRQRMLAEEFGRGPPRLLVSDNGGRTWQSLANDPRQFIIGQSWPVFLGSDGWWLDWQAFSGTGARLTGPVGLWHTSDGGRTWQRLAASGIPPFGYVDRVRFEDQRHGLLAMISAGDQGRAMIVATSDGGATWEPSTTFDTPLAETRPLGIVLLQHETRLLAWVAVSPSTGPGPIAGEQSGVRTFVSVSDDGGGTWGPFRPGPVPTPASTAGAIVDSEGRLVVLDGHRLWISADGGATWLARVTVMPEGLIPVFIAAAVPGSMYALAVQSSEVSRLGNAPASLLRSADGGIHWTDVRLPRA